MPQLNNQVERLETEKILTAIEPDNQRYLAKLEILGSIDSTNTYLLAQAKNGAEPGTVCFAEQQTQGRGRRGRVWFSPDGANIYCSMLWQFAAMENISGLSIAVAVMVVSVLKKYGISTGIQLKWPNDILFEGRKLAGILLERSGNSIVIGVGLNLYLPVEADSAWVSLYDMTGQPAARNYLAGLLVNELIAQLRFYQTRGLGGFLHDWRKYDCLRGRAVTVSTPEKTMAGVMQGINDQGELLLQDEQGLLRLFSYGEVSVRF